MTASQIARLLASSVCIVVFVKADGSTRRMMTVPGPNGVGMKGGLVTVWDAEKGAWRRVNTATVQTIKPLNARPHTANRAPVQHAEPAWIADFDMGFRPYAR